MADTSLFLTSERCSATGSAPQFRCRICTAHILMILFSFPEVWDPDIGYLCSRSVAPICVFSILSSLRRLSHMECIEPIFSASILRKQRGDCFASICVCSVQCWLTVNFIGEFYSCFIGWPLDLGKNDFICTH